MLSEWEKGTSSFQRTNSEHHRRFVTAWRGTLDRLDILGCYYQTCRWKLQLKVLWRPRMKYITWKLSVSMDTVTSPISLFSSPMFVSANAGELVWLTSIHPVGKRQWLDAMIDDHWRCKVGGTRLNFSNFEVRKWSNFERERRVLLIEYDMLGYTLLPRKPELSACLQLTDFMY